MLYRNMQKIMKLLSFDRLKFIDASLIMFS